VIPWLLRVAKVSSPYLPGAKNFILAMQELLLASLPLFAPLSRLCLRDYIIAVNMGTQGQLSRILNETFTSVIHLLLPFKAAVRATGHKTPGESSEIRMRLLKGYSTLYTRFTFLMSGSV